MPDSGSPGRPFILPVFLPQAGCPHRCAFCDQPAITGQSRTPPSDAELRAHIETFLSYRRDSARPVEIAFFGGTFLGQPPAEIDRLLALAGDYVRRGVARSIRLSTRPDSVDDAGRRRLSAAPVGTVELGAQSMDDRVLSAVRRGHRAEDTVRAVGMLRTDGYRVGLQMMVGLPGEEASGSKWNAERIASLEPDFVRIYPTLVLAGSPLARWVEAGRYRPLSLAEAVVRTQAAYQVFSEAGIPVIRMGLQPSETLEAAVVAGPFHPAFGHLVLSAVQEDRAAAVLEAAGIRGGVATLRVHPRSVARMRGDRNETSRRLRDRFDLTDLRVLPDPTVPPGRVALGESPSGGVIPRRGA
jgi:histone acetyltransferase (RNA polymerase elongator complex component)